MADSFSVPPIADVEKIMEWIEDQIPDVEIDSETCVPLTRAGERMDWDLAVGHLFA